MPTLDSSATIPLLFLAGVVASVGVHEVRLWLGRRRDAFHLWVAAWCAMTLPVLASHYLQTVAETSESAELGARLAWMSALFLIAVMIGLSHALAGRPLPRGRLAGIVGADLALAAFVWLGDNFVKADVSLRTDRLDATYWMQESSPFTTVLVPCLFAVFAYCLATVWRARALPRGERRAILAGSGATSPWRSTICCTPRGSSRACASSTTPSSGSRWACTTWWWRGSTGSPPTWRAR